MRLSLEEKQWLLSRSKRLLNYLVLKIGLFAILSVWAAADFVNASTVFRVIYGLIGLGLVFYLYLYWDTRKYLQQIDKIVKAQ